jgi:hypothetical protein
MRALLLPPIFERNILRIGSPHGSGRLLQGNAPLSDLSELLDAIDSNDGKFYWKQGA